MEPTKSVKAFDADKYKWRGFNPRIERGFRFRLKPWVNRGANFRELHFLWWRFGVSWLWNPHTIWNDGWDAHFRQTLAERQAWKELKSTTAKTNP